MLTLLQPQDAYFNRSPLLSVLDRLPQDYGQEFDLISELKHYWIYVTHPDYGVIGGLRLTPPHSDPSLFRHDPFFTALSVGSSKHWLASYLFFHLPDEIMDNMPDYELFSLMRQFYADLYQGLQQFSHEHQVPAFALLSSSCEYQGASMIGLLPFRDELFYRDPGQDKEYTVGFLTMDQASEDLFQQHRALEQHTLFHTSGCEN